MNSRMGGFSVAAVVSLACGLAGCSSQEKAGSTTSALSGTLALKTFADQPTAVSAVNERGQELLAQPDETGAFQLVLKKGHTYSLAVLLANGSEPVVFPRANGHLDTTFRIKGGAALVALGAVRHFSGAPDGGFVTLSLQTPSASAGAGGQAGEGEVGECVDGFTQGSGQPCADDDGQVSCEAGDGDQVGEGEPGECVDGFIQGTGAACADGDAEVVDDETDAVDPAQPMAVADHNVPDDVGGCDEGGEQEEQD